MKKTRFLRCALALALLCVCLAAFGGSARAWRDEMVVRIPVFSKEANCTVALYDEDTREVGQLRIQRGTENYFLIPRPVLGRTLYTLRVISQDTARVHYDRTVYEISVYTYYNSADELAALVDVRPEGDVSAPKLPRAEFVHETFPKVTAPPAETNGESPRTSDERNLSLWMGLTGGSLALILALALVLLRRGKKRD